MSIVKMLVRHHLTRWLRHRTWGAGDVAGQVVLLGMVVAFLLPVGLGSYLFGDLVRSFNSQGNVLELGSLGTWLLLPGFTALRFLTQSATFERLHPYSTLPVSRLTLIHTQMALCVASIHTLVAAFVVVPFWASEVLGVLAPRHATAWLGTALLLSIALPTILARGLHQIFGRHARVALGITSGLCVLILADASLSAVAFPQIARWMISAPAYVLIGTLVPTCGLYAVLVRYLKKREVRLDSRSGGSGARPPTGVASRVWPAAISMNRLILLELRHITRTRRLRGTVARGVAVIALYLSAFLAGAVGGEFAVYTFVVWGNWMTWEVGIVGFAASYRFLPAIEVRPVSPLKVVRAKYVTVTLLALPSIVMMAVSFAVLEVQTYLSLASLIPWVLGAVVPAVVHASAWSKQPVDDAASALTASQHVTVRQALLLVAALLIPPFIVAIGASSSTLPWWLGPAWFASVGAVLGLSQRYIRQKTVNIYTNFKHSVIQME